MGAGEACGTAADHGNSLARRVGAGEGMFLFSHQFIGGVALQHSDLDGLALRFLADTDFLAEGLSRADAGAHAAQYVLVKNCFGGVLRMARGNLADEEGNID